MQKKTRYAYNKLYKANKEESRSCGLSIGQTDRRKQRGVAITPQTRD